MKLPIRHIAVLVLISLLGIFAYQGYWLGNMYKATQANTKSIIRDAIQNADHVEVFMRADSLGRALRVNGSASITGKVAFSNYFDKHLEEHQLVKRTDIKNEVGKTKHYSLSLNEDIDSDSAKTDKRRDDSLGIGKSFHSLERLGTEVQKALHTALDLTYSNINLSHFDSVMHHELKAHQLNIRHYTQVVALANDSVMMSSLPSSVDTSRMDHWERIYDISNQFAYRVYTEPTGVVVLKQMTGILVSSFFILLIIVASFVYLIRIILQQRTLDEMKTDFTNNVTHELKTPIAVAYAANDALLHFKQGEVKEQRDRYLQISMEQLQRLSRLVEQILSMSMERRKTLTLHPETIVVRDLIRSLIEQQKLKAEKPVEIVYAEEPDGLTLEADRTHLGNIIGNLLDNAIKYSGDVVRVEVNCRRDETGNVTIAVKDNGIGISAECQKHVFEKFYRVPTGNHHDRKGYGLGLYYVSTILTRMNGSIRVESEPGKGSTFTVTLWKGRK